MIYLLLAQGMNRGGPRTGSDDEDMYDDDDDDDDVRASPLRRTALFAFQVSQLSRRLNPPDECYAVNGNRVRPCGCRAWGSRASWRSLRATWRRSIDCRSPSVCSETPMPHQ